MRKMVKGLTGAMLTAGLVIRIATYNVNSIRAREERLLAWLDTAKPDVVLLQELKVEDDKFPALTLKAVGYEAAWLGQKTYNGVAILSKQPITEVKTSFDDGHEDPQARFISGTTYAKESSPAITRLSGSSFTTPEQIRSKSSFQRA